MPKFVRQNILFLESLDGSVSVTVHRSQENQINLTALMQKSIDIHKSLLGSDFVLLGSNNNGQIGGNSAYTFVYRVGEHKNMEIGTIKDGNLYTVKCIHK